MNPAIMARDSCINIISLKLTNHRQWYITIINSIDAPLSNADQVGSFDFCSITRYLTRELFKWRIVGSL